jgi:hypothetical protein
MFSNDASAPAWCRLIPFAIRQKLSTTVYRTAMLSTMALVGTLGMPGFVGGNNRTLSHCSAHEQVIFSCQITSSKKVLSVCASEPLDAPERYLQYRYGALKSVELEFPSQRAESVKYFKTAHYFRARVDRREITFTNKEVGYAVFSYYEGEESPPQRQAGVTIYKGKSAQEGKTLRCVTPYIDHLSKLDDVVACDPNSPLSLGGCPK